MGVVLFPLLAIAVAGSNFPFWDQIDYVDWFWSFQKGTFSIATLFRPHNEYLQVIPNLIFFFLGVVTHWDPRWEMVSSWLFVLGSYLLVRRFLANRSTQSHLVNLAIAALLFSPLQLTNWLNGVQLVYFTSILLLFTALSFDISTTRGLALSSLSCFMATLSSANGITTWFAVVPLLLSARAKTATWLFWFFALAFSSAVYVSAFPDSHALTKNASFDVTRAGLFFLGAVGRLLELSVFKCELEPYRWWQFYSSKILGASFLLVLALLVRRALIRKAAITPYCVGLILFSLASLALVSIGRSQHSPDQSLTSRYITFATPMYVAALILLESTITIHKAAVLRASTLFLLLPLLLGPSKLKGYWTIREHAKTCWALSLVAPGNCIGAYLYPDQPGFLLAADKIEEMGYAKITRPRALATTLEAQRPLNGSAAEVVDDRTQTFTGYSEGENAPLATVITCSNGPAITVISDLPPDNSTGRKRWPVKAEIPPQCIDPRGFTILSLTN